MILIKAGTRRRADDDANCVLIAAIVLCFLRGSVLGVTPPAPLLPLSPGLLPLLERDFVSVSWMLKYPFVVGGGGKMADTIDNDDDDDLAEKRSLLTGALRTLLLFSVVLIGVSTAPATAALFAVVVVVVVVIFWGVRLAISRYISVERP